ncbi:CoB--CoM heterodisulfide reductase subunit C [uncultured Methanobrevibacter sp.]|uniref:CoB--CoM heterodisulfide reductase subunit C n=1 Tax=uncultured Methanobrevibacter sp. TaxID=253161 RepID=UPI0025EE1AB2|nr:CoB--CoM heterodisulfide reductase subunit C [uncultured Methanobrevibacter sp.]
MSVFDLIKSLFGINKDVDKEKKVETSTKVDKSTDKQTSSNESTVSNSKDSTIQSSEPDIKTNKEEVKHLKVDISSEVEELNKTPKKASKAQEDEVKENVEEEISNDGLDSSEEIEEEILVESEDNSEDENETNKERDNMTLLNDNDVYTLDDIDFDFKERFVEAGLETVEHCFQCGTCGGGCPSGRRTPYRVRQIVRKCLLGLREEVISDPALWMCTTCYTCQERCPRSVTIVDIIKFARNEAAHAGYMADAHKATGKFVIESGHGVPINDKVKALRKEIGLDEVPPTTHKYSEALNEVQAICKACEFDKLVGYEGL